MLVIHGAAFPWRLFHLATGENFIGESLSTIWHSDFSRLMPSFIRPNMAAVVGSVLLVVSDGSHCHPEPPEPRSAKAEGGGRSKDPLPANPGRAAVRTSSTSA